MNETRKSTLIDFLINFIPVGLAFLMPLFFLSITTEFFEFNKLALLTVATFVLIILWVVRMISVKKVYLTRSRLDAGLLALLVSVILSSVFSLDKISSVFGSYGRWFPSLFSFVTLFAFYYVVSSNTNSLKVVKAITTALVASSTLSTLVALLGYFGIKLSSSPAFQAPSFNLAGSTLTVSFLAVLAVILSFTFVLNTKTVISKVVFSQVLIINLIGVALIGYTTTYAALIIGLLAVLYLTPVAKIKENRVHLIGLAGVTAALLAVLIVPTTRNVIINKNYLRELPLSSRESQIIAFSVLRDYPLVGSGPSTFYLDFPIYKSLFLNGTNLWNVRFDKPSSEVFNIIASLGILGICAVILLGAKLLKLVVASKALKEETGTLSAVIAGLLATLALMTLSYANVLTSFILVTFLASLVSIYALSDQKEHAQNVSLSLSSLNTSANSMSILGEMGERNELLPYILAVPVIGLVLFGSYQFYRNYAAEVYMRKAIVAAVNNSGSTSYQMQAKAISIFPGRDSYHTAYARTNILLANSLASKQNLSDSEKQTVQVLISQAIRSARLATEVVNPINVANWETRAFIYRSLMGAAQDADQWAVSAYNAAIQLDPSNPRLRLDLGGLYFSKKDYLNAANMFRQAISLKSDYANAHYNFAHSLIQLKSYADAQRELEIVERLVPQDSEDYKKAAADIEEVKKLITASGAAENTKPSVEQLESNKQPAAQTQPTTQEPLVKPGTEEKVTPQQQPQSSTQQPAQQTNPGTSK